MQLSNMTENTGNPLKASFTGEKKENSYETIGKMKKARNFGQKIRKKGLTETIRYGRIFPHWRTYTSSHVAIEYSTREMEFQPKFAKLVVFTGKMPCKCCKMMWFLFKLNKNQAFLTQGSRFRK